ncbi:9063_t:CDS:2 [Diversispora eburnea]|uniref:9063_t:CDS:1 n=1 Tax=Diversispora eburnea TaxID=1213867 RepID=A0A9N9CWL6_9GLOM|nr:9063_t:CDS:2 [Diversispora eburnea]
MYEQQITYDDPHVIASSSTGESSNRTLQGDFIENTDYLNVPQIIPRPRKNNNIPTVYQRLSDRYTFTFSADLIAQFDKYRSQMRESIRQELETDEEEMIFVSNIENEEETFSVHQVHHSNFGSNLCSQDSNFGSNLYSQDSNRDITSESAPKSCLPKSNQKRKYQIFSFFLRGKSKPQQNITASDMDIRSISVADTQEN